MKLSSSRLRIAKLVVITCLVLIALGASLFLRSGYVSEKLRGLIMPQVNSHTDLSIEAGSFYINLLPLYLGANDIQVKEVGSIENVRVYADATSLLMGKVQVDRIVLDTPYIKLDAGKLDSLVPGRKPDSGNSTSAKGFNAAIIINNGSLTYQWAGKSAPTVLHGIDLEFSQGDKYWISFNIAEVHYDIPLQKWPEIDFSLKGAATYDKSTLEIVNLKALMQGSTFTVNGRVDNPGKKDMRGILALELDLLPKSIMDTFEITTPPDGRLKTSGELTLAPSVDRTMLRLDMNGNFYLETLLQALRVKKETVESLAGHISAKGTLAGPLTDLRGTAEAVIRDSVMYDLSLESATAKVTYGSGRLHISEGRGSLYRGTADVDVSFSVLGNEPFSVSVAFDNVDSVPALRRIHIDKIGLAEGKVEGIIRSNGPTFAPEGWARYRSNSTSATPLGRVDYISGKFYTSSDHDLMLEEFNVRTPLSHAAFDGYIGLSSDGLAFNGYVMTTDITDMLVPFDYGLKGGGRIELSVKGTKSKPIVHTKARMWNMAFRNYELGKTEADISYNVENVKVLAINSVNVDESASVTGNIFYPDAERIFDLSRPEFEISADIANGNLSDMVGLFVQNVDIKGKASTRLTIRGGVNALDIKGNALISNITAYGRPLDKANFDYYYKEGEIGINSSEIYASGSSASISGNYNRNRTFMVNAKSKGLPMTLILPDYTGPDYRVDMNLSGLGSMDNPTILMEARMGAVRFHNLMVGGGTVALTLKDNILDADLDLMDGNLKAKGGMSLSGNRPWRADLSFGYERYDFILSSLFSKHPEDMVLAFEGNIHLEGNRQSVKANVEMSKANIKAYGRGFANIGPLKIDILNRNIYFKNVKMRAAHMDFALAGMLEVGRRFDMSVKASASLLPIAGYVSAIEGIKGDSNLDLRVTGKWTSPALDGEFSINDASVTLASISQRIGNINALVRFEGNRLIVSRAEAKVGGGQVNLGGIVELGETMKPSTINLEASINNVSARLRPGISMELEGSLLMSGNSAGQQLGGDIRITKAIYRDRVEWKRWLLERKTRAAKSKQQWMRNMALNIKVHGHENLIVENNLLNTRLRVDLYVKGTLAEPALLGRVEAVGGNAYFRSSELEIMSATADFSDLDPGRPMFSLIAEDSIKGYDIWLNLDGKADQLNLSLSSNPPLEDTEILSLLTYGDLSSSVDNIESGLGTAEATFLLTGKIQDLMEERLALFTGLDRLQIDPYVSHSTGEIAPRLIAGKKLLDGKMNMTYASTLDASSEQEIKIEYMLNDNVSVEGGKNYTGSLGGDLKLKFDFE